MNLHSGASLTTGAQNDCVPTALALATGEPAAVWLERLRRYQPKACTKRMGTGPAAYRRALSDAGYNTEAIYDGGWRETIPLHRACAMLKGRVGLLVIRSDGYGSHMVAAQGFIVGDNARRPQWWADYLFQWSLAWRGRRIVRSRVRAQVIMVFLLRKEAA